MAKGIKQYYCEIYRQQVDKHPLNGWQILINGLHIHVVHADLGIQDGSMLDQMQLLV